jgi:hypothetical protein
LSSTIPRILSGLGRITSGLFAFQNLIIRRSRTSGSIDFVHYGWRPNQSWCAPGATVQSSIQSANPSNFPIQGVVHPLFNSTSGMQHIFIFSFYSLQFNRPGRVQAIS